MGFWAVIGIAAAVWLAAEWGRNLAVQKLQPRLDELSDRIRSLERGD